MPEPNQNQKYWEILSWLLEPILNRGEYATRAYPEVVLRAWECAVVDVLVATPVEHIVGGERQTDFVVEPPYSRGIKQYEVGGVTFWETGHENALLR